MMFRLEAKQLGFSLFFFVAACGESEPTHPAVTATGGSDSIGVDDFRYYSEHEDQDRDFLRDEVEREFGFDPTTADTDRDGCTDDFEFLFDGCDAGDLVGVCHSLSLSIPASLARPTPWLELILLDAAALGAGGHGGAPLDAEKFLPLAFFPPSAGQIEARSFSATAEPAVVDLWIESFRRTSPSSERLESPLLFRLPPGLSYGSYEVALVERDSRAVLFSKRVLSRCSLPVLVI